MHTVHMQRYFHNFALDNIYTEHWKTTCVWNCFARQVTKLHHMNVKVDLNLTKKCSIDTRAHTHTHILHAIFLHLYPTNTFCSRMILFRMAFSTVRNICANYPNFRHFLWWTPNVSFMTMVNCASSTNTDRSEVMSAKSNAQIQSLWDVLSLFAIILRVYIGRISLRQ